MAESSTPPLRVGISACLLGRPVRFDGGHKRDEFLADLLGKFVEWIPVCPEVETGLGTPRETLRLVRVGDDVRMITTTTGRDHSTAMRAYATRKLNELAGEHLSGFVLKKDSPSCGVERVAVYEADRVVSRDGTGLFAAALQARFPLLPIEDEDQLRDARRRENFVERIFAYQRLAAFFGSRWTVGGLTSFHAAHKLTLLAHEPATYRALGQLVASAREVPRAELKRRYSERFMNALRVTATPGRHGNVLRHMAGYFRDRLDPTSRMELSRVIDRYAAGEVPLAVPIALLRRHIRRHQLAYLEGQVYLMPYPAALRLRDHL